MIFPSGDTAGAFSADGVDRNGRIAWGESTGAMKISSDRVVLGRALMATIAKNPCAGPGLTSNSFIESRFDPHPIVAAPLPSHAFDMMRDESRFVALKKTRAPSRLQTGMRLELSVANPVREPE